MTDRIVKTVELASSPTAEAELKRRQLLDTELRFYGTYTWTLNPFPTIREVIEHLRSELTRMDELEEEWHRTEIETNVYLLACAILDTVDDYLHGNLYDFSRTSAVIPVLRPAIWVVHRLQATTRRVRAIRLRYLHAWREKWNAGVVEFLQILVTRNQLTRENSFRVRSRLLALLRAELPADLGSQRARVPAAFYSQDFTHFDVLKLGDKFITRFPARETPLLIVGIRTAGSYLAPLLCAYLASKGYANVRELTMRPKNGLGHGEHAKLVAFADRPGLILFIDEPPKTGGTLVKGIELLRKAGLAANRFVLLVPVHRTGRDWTNAHEALPLRGLTLFSLEPQEQHKYHLLEPQVVQRRLEEYYRAHGYQTVELGNSDSTERFVSELNRLSVEKFHTRLKRVYQVHLNDEHGRSETRFVLAKSVGWGWLGYHAFSASSQLRQFIPPVLGLRDGILYTEWLPQQPRAMVTLDREQVVKTVASYVAARRRLGLGKDPSPELSRANRHQGFQILAQVLSQAYRWNKVAVLKRPRIQYELSGDAALCPTMIDGKMDQEEWITRSSSLLKTDFEQHGLGKWQLNITDPTYDLAGAILHLRLTENEETQLISQYVQESNDAVKEDRLILLKLLAGTEAMSQAASNLRERRLLHRAEEFNQQYVSARRFLTIQTVRFTGRFCGRKESASWHTPLVVMDIDGVLDKQVFGFPSTTWAGIEALRLLHAHGVATTVNTARTLAEVKEYCKYYGFVGGVAEGGSVIWDGVSDKERVLVSEESLAQMENVRDALRQIPGVFLDDTYEYSLRAYTFQGTMTVPVPAPIIQGVMARLEIDRLRFHQTYLDTAITAQEIDKGKGLLALLTLAGQENIETVAIGDSEPDLAMFRVATRCSAPGQISCPEIAKSLGCQIVDRSYQPGLLSILKRILHQTVGQCDRCRTSDQFQTKPEGLLLYYLKVADDQKPAIQLLKAMFDPLSLRAFAR